MQLVKNGRNLTPILKCVPYTASFARAEHGTLSAHLRHDEEVVHCHLYL
jgi:hypothetical protein